MFEQKIFPAISSVKNIEKFLETDIEYCVLMNFSLMRLKSLCQLVHQNGKKCIVHIDLIKGVSNDEYGAEFLIHELKVDGLISTRPGVIQYAKSKNIIAIQRIFLIDSHSLEKSLLLANKTKPDYIEILPGIACSIVEEIRGKIDIPLIGGGLINSEEALNSCLSSGLNAVTTSNYELWRKQ